MQSDVCRQLWEIVFPFVTGTKASSSQYLHRLCAANDYTVSVDSEVVIFCVDYCGDLLRRSSHSTTNEMFPTITYVNNVLLSENLKLISGFRAEIREWSAKIMTHFFRV